MTAIVDDFTTWYTSTSTYNTPAIHGWLSNKKISYDFEIQTIDQKTKNWTVIDPIQGGGPFGIAQLLSARKISVMVDIPNDKSKRYIRWSWNSFSMGNDYSINTISWEWNFPWNFMEESMVRKIEIMEKIHGFPWVKSMDSSIKIGNSWNKVLAASRRPSESMESLRPELARVVRAKMVVFWWVPEETRHVFFHVFFSRFFPVFFTLCVWFLWEFPWQCLCNIREAYIKDLWLRGWNSHKHP